jgi:hypothetical protein
MPCLYIQSSDTYRLWSAEHNSRIVVFGVIQRLPARVMVKYRETKACNVDLKLTAVISLWTLNRAHCQLEILLIPLDATFFLVTKYSPTSRGLLTCLPQFPFTLLLPRGLFEIQFAI